jgi:hypothetical protein
MTQIPQQSERKKPAASREKIVSGQPQEHIRQLLLEGEQVVRIAQIHPAIYWKGGVLGAISILCMILFPGAMNLWLFLLFVAGILLVYASLTKHFLMLALTNKRVLFRYGIIKMDVVQIHHRKVESVELGWTILGQMLGYASVMITGTGSRVSIIPYVANAPQFRKDMESIVMEIEEGKTAGTVPPNADGPVQGNA